MKILVSPMLLFVLIISPDLDGLHFSMKVSIESLCGTQKGKDSNCLVVLC